MFFVDVLWCYLSCFCGVVVVDLVIDDDVFVVFDCVGVVGMWFNLVGLLILDFGMWVWCVLFVCINVFGWYVEIYCDVVDLYVIVVSLFV